MGGTRTILVVDDDARNRRLLRSFLESYEVLDASSGTEALEILARAPVDLVLLDVMMPAPDGFETCRRIKAQPRESFLPVLLVTALTAQDDRNRGLEAGADDFLAKPVDRRELRLRVRAFLRLREQEEELRKLQSFKDDMVSLLVHDLRNPLAGMLSAIELALEGASEPRLRDDLRNAHRSGETMRGVLDETLQVKLLEERKLVARRAPADVRALVAGAREAIEPVTRRKQIELRAAVEGEPRAEVDEKLVRRSLDNLLSNAVKYTPAGGAIEVHVRNGGDGLTLEVSDSGKGIPDDLKSTLFGRFGSVEAQRGQQRRGVGLGLYLVKLVAEAHEGDVSVHDAPGGGARFRLHLSPRPQPAP